MEKEGDPLSVAISMPIERDRAEAIRPTASRRANAFKVELPSLFNTPAIVSLFERGFTGTHEHFGVDPEEMRVYTRDRILEPGYGGVPHWLNFWVVMKGQEFCGFIIASYSPWPQCPNVCLAHIHVDRPDVSDALITKAFGWAYGYGLTKVSICNASGKPDDVYMRWFRKYGRGSVKGSMMEIDLEDRHGRRT